MGAVNETVCFLLMPYSQPWSEGVWRVIDGAVRDCGLECQRADEDQGQHVMEDVWKGLCEARVVIADLTGSNPNVTYEVGVTDVLGKDLIILSQDPEASRLPFNFLGRRLLPYACSPSGLRRLREDLRHRLNGLLGRGRVRPSRSMRVLMVAAEASPFAKTGGLADVLEALPRTLVRRGVEVSVILPRYRGVSLDGTRQVDASSVQLPYRGTVHRLEGAVDHYFLDCPPLFDREGLYGEGGRDYPDNALRFATLARAALALARRLEPHVIHCHDWQAALLPVYLRTSSANDAMAVSAKTVLTIHNLAYQGRFPRATFADLDLDERLFSIDGLEFYGDINFLKGGIVFADTLTTASPRYAKEIQSADFGEGLDGLLRARCGALRGILNGVDIDRWDPWRDPALPAHFSMHDLSGKAECKRALLAELDLPARYDERPLVAMIGRLAEQKGLDIVAAASDALFAEDLLLVILGSGDSRRERALEHIARAHPDRFALRIGFDDGLAHRIEAGADMLLMPSRYEPCGLSQLYSMRYGTIPVVAAVGGLVDTVSPEVGFLIPQPTREALLDTMRAALAAYRDRDGWTARIHRAMRQDFSWDRSAAEYETLYEQLLSG